MLSLGQKLKFKKTCEKRLLNNIRVVLCKTTLQKTQISKNRKNWSQRMGYSFCKMLTLGQKLKFKNTCEKRLLNNIRVVLCKITLQKTQGFENRKNWSQRKGYSLCKMVSLGQKLKF